jgi:hypothetical protein
LKTQQFRAFAHQHALTLTSQAAASPRTRSQPAESFCFYGGAEGRMDEHDPRGDSADSGRLEAKCWAVDRK